MAELVRVSQGLAAEGKGDGAKGRWATEADVARWEKDVAQLASEFKMWWYRRPGKGGLGGPESIVMVA